LNTISVITPCYNERDRVVRLIEEHTRQTRQPDELIVVDDCSTDGSYEMLKSLKCPFLTVLRSPSNIGPVAATKIGFDAAAGGHVFFGAMDDGLEPDFIEKMMQQAFIFPQAGILLCDVREGEQTLIHRFEPGYSDPHQMASQMQGQHICGCSTVWRRNVVEPSRLFDAALSWHSDWFASQVAALTHGAAYVPQIMARTTYRPDSFSNRGRRDWAQQAPILEHILGLMNAPEFYHLLPAFIWAKSMNHFPEVPRLLLEKPYLMTGTNRLLLRDALARVRVSP